MADFYIDELFAGAWDQAIIEVANLVNSSTATTRKYDSRDWLLLEAYALQKSLVFDADGYLVG